MAFDMSKLSDDLRAIATDLGMPEIERLVAELSTWNKTATIASIESGATGEYNFEMTPTLAIEWAVLAETIAKETGLHVTVHGNYIMRPRTDDEMLRSILNSEKYKREQAKKVAEKNAEKDAK